MLVAVLAGGLYGLLRPSKTVSPTPVAAGSSSGTPSASASGKPSASATPSASASKTPTKTPAPRKTAYVTDPASTPGLDFGIVAQVEQTADGLTITMDRAEFLTGTKAQEYYTQHPDQEPLDYAVSNVNTRLRTFTVTKDAVVYSQLALGDGQEINPGQKITLDQFYEKTVQLLARKEPLMLWLRHTDGADGPVYYIAEQYVP